MRQPTWVGVDVVTNAGRATHLGVAIGATVLTIEFADGSDAELRADLVELAE